MISDVEDDKKNHSIENDPLYRTGIKIASYNDPAGGVLVLVLKGGDNPMVVTDRLIPC